MSCRRGWRQELSNQIDSIEVIKCIWVSWMFKYVDKEDKKSTKNIMRRYPLSTKKLAYGEKYREEHYHIKLTRSGEAS